MMKLSVSNIAWDGEVDGIVYREMESQGYQGLEIAPTRIFPSAPYEQLKNASIWSRQLFEKYGIKVSSMQSIWYGRTERLFGTRQEREKLFFYTQKAMDFALAVGCRNLVLGSPKNRNRESGEEVEPVQEFFERIGNYADSMGVILALEPNPKIYGTNFINTTEEAFNFINRLQTKGIGVNLDLGTIRENRETLPTAVKDWVYIHHIHVSEPYLGPIRIDELYQKLGKVIPYEYDGYLSIEMGKADSLQQLFQIMREVKQGYGVV